MGTTRIVNIDPTGAAREIIDTGDFVAHGESVEVPTELAERLLEQETVWARPTTKAARAAKDGPPAPPPAEPAAQP